MEGIHTSGGGGGAPTKRRVLVVADPTRESAAALQWALSHAVLEHDDIILLHIDPPSSSTRRTGPLSTFLRRPVQTAPSSSFNSFNSSSTSAAAGEGGEGDFLEGMRAACEAAQPKVKVQIQRVEMDGKDKASTILLHTSMFGADLLVIGQRRSGSILGRKLTASMSGKGMDTAEYLIEHSKCLCVGVQKKGQNAGYLLNTKTHKNFWLLA